MVPGGRPSAPRSRAIREDSIPPTQRLTLRICRSSSTGPPPSSAAAAPMMSSWSRASSSTGGGGCIRRRGSDGSTSVGKCSRCDRSTPRPFQWSIASSARSRSVRPMSSEKERTPSVAMIWRTSSATKKK
jgi:hypothetical protein